MTKGEVQWEEGSEGSVLAMCQGREQESIHYLRKKNCSVWLKDRVSRGEFREELEVGKGWMYCCVCSNGQ